MVGAQERGSGLRNSRSRDAGGVLGGDSPNTWEGHASHLRGRSPKALGFWASLNGNHLVVRGYCRKNTSNPKTNKDSGSLVLINSEPFMSERQMQHSHSIDASAWQNRGGCLDVDLNLQPLLNSQSCKGSSQSYPYNPPNIFCRSGSSETGLRVFFGRQPIAQSRDPRSQSL